MFYKVKTQHGKREMNESEEKNPERWWWMKANKKADLVLLKTFQSYFFHGNLDLTCKHCKNNTVQFFGIIFPIFRKRFFAKRLAHWFSSFWSEWLGLYLFFHASMLGLSLSANHFGLCWTPDGYSTKSASSYRSQAPFLCRYKSLLDVVTGSDWSISTAPQPWWKISGLSEGGMAFVHPTVTDHVLTVTHPHHPPLPAGPPTVYGHLNPPSLVSSEASITSYRPSSSHIPSSYLCLARPVRLHGPRAHTFKSSWSPQHTTLCCPIHHHRLLAEQVWRGGGGNDLRLPWCCSEVHQLGELSICFCQ